MVDPRTGIVTNSWFRWFTNVFQLTGSGSSPASIVDLLITPNPETLRDPSGRDALQQVETLAFSPDLGPVYGALNALNEQPDFPDLAPIMAALDGLSLAPATTAANGGGGTVTSIVAGAGLTGGTITTTGTVAIDFASANTWTARQIFNRPNTPVVAVATLPATPVAGDRAMVNDALAPVFGAAVAAGGAAIVPVYYSGAAWLVG